MRTLIAIAASAAINVALLTALEVSTLAAQAPPHGEVVITQLHDASDVAALARAEKDAQRSVVL